MPPGSVTFCGTLFGLIFSALNLDVFMLERMFRAKFEADFTMMVIWMMHKQFLSSVSQVCKADEVFIFSGFIIIFLVRTLILVIPNELRTRNQILHRVSRDILHFETILDFLCHLTLWHLVIMRPGVDLLAFQQVVNIFQAGNDVIQFSQGLKLKIISSRQTVHFSNFYMGNILKGNTNDFARIIHSIATS